MYCAEKMNKNAIRMFKNSLKIKKNKEVSKKLEMLELGLD